MRYRTVATTSVLAYALVLVTVLAAAPGAFAAEPRTVAITTDDTMQFSVTRIVAGPGERITVTLEVRSSLPREQMAHNWVLLDPETDVTQFVMAAVVARDSGHIPPAQQDRVLALTPLAGGGETVQVTFEAPREPGDYPYVCTFPGHYWGGMKGVLVVR